MDRETRPNLKDRTRIPPVLVVLEETGTRNVGEMDVNGTRQKEKCVTKRLNLRVIKVEEPVESEIYDEGNIE